MKNLAIAIDDAINNGAKSAKKMVIILLYVFSATTPDYSPPPTKLHKEIHRTHAIINTIPTTNFGLSFSPNRKNIIMATYTQ